MYEYSMKIQANKVKILALSTHLCQTKVKARRRVWIVQNNLHIAETRLSKGTCPKQDGNFAAEMKLPTSLHASA